MKLKSVKIRGFEGIPPEPAVDLNDLSDFNVIIGPNNVGKSSIFRCLHHVEQALVHAQKSVEIGRQLPPQLFWREEAKEISVSLVGVTGNVTERLGDVHWGYAVYNGEWRFDVRFRRTGKPSGTLVIPRVFFEGLPDWIPIADIVEDKLAWYIHVEKAYKTAGSDPYASMLGNWFNTYKRWSNSTRFIGPLRNSTGQSTIVPGVMDNGAGLLQELFKIQSETNLARKDKNLKKSILRQINSLLRSSQSPEVESFAVKGDQRSPQLIVTVNDHPTLLQNMGSGIAELVLSSFFLFSDAEDTSSEINLPTSSRSLKRTCIQGCFAGSSRISRVFRIFSSSLIRTPMSS